VNSLTDRIRRALSFSRERTTEYIETIFMNCPKDEMNDLQKNDAGCFYVGADWEASRRKPIEDALVSVAEAASAKFYCNCIDDICDHVRLRDAITALEAALGLGEIK
jgi:hypothetical protein